MKSKTGSSVSDDDDHHVKSAEGSREIVISLRIKNVPEDCDHDNKEVDDRRKSPQSTTIVDEFFAKYFRVNPEFFQQAFQFVLCCIGLQVTYNLWGQMQERIMTTRFEPTPNVPSGQFPSAAFCVCFNLLVAVLVGMIAVCIQQHGAVLDNNNNNNNKVPFYYFKPCAISNLVSSHSQYAALQYVSFQTQTIVKCSKLVPVMTWGTALVGAQYPVFQYLEALLVTAGMIVFLLFSKSFSNNDTETELWGVILCIMYLGFDAFTSQWQARIYKQYGKENVDPFQMMLGVNLWAVSYSLAGLVHNSGDLSTVFEFLAVNKQALWYCIISAISSTFGQLCIFYTIKEMGPVAFTIIMTNRLIVFVCISAVVFGHAISFQATLGAILALGVLLHQIRNKYIECKQ